MKKYITALTFSITLTGCGGGSKQQDEPIVVEPPPPSYPTSGTIIEETCNGTTLVQTIANGNGGSTQKQIENSEKCGYVPPPTVVSDENYCEGYTLINKKEYSDGTIEEEVIEEQSEQCGYEPVPDLGTPIGNSYCAGSLRSEQYDPLFESINHLLPEDRLQDYADGEGGTYTERTVHIDQTCFVPMVPPDDCPTTASATGDPRYNYITCDGVKQKTPVSFPYQEDHAGRAIIDMLIIFDSNITEQERDGMTVEEFVNEQFFRANHMYIANGTYTLLRLAGIKMVDVADADLYRQYNAFFNGRYEFNGLDDWQREAGADLVFLFKKRYSDPVACGVASLDATRGITKTRGITQCYHNSIFQESEVTRYYNRAHETFAHEVGHLLGLEHEWQDANSEPIFEYGYGYNLPGYQPQKNNPEYEGVYSGYGTIMTYADLATGRFSDRSVTCNFPEEAGEYAGQSVTLGTDGGCFCLEPIENQPPPTDSVDQIRRVRYLMSQLHEQEHGLQFSPVPIGHSQEDDPVWSIWTNVPSDICFF